MQWSKQDFLFARNRNSDEENTNSFAQLLHSRYIVLTLRDYSVVRFFLSKKVQVSSAWVSHSIDGIIGNEKKIYVRSLFPS